MALLRLGNFIVNDSVIGVVELYPEPTFGDCVHVHLMKATGNNGASIGGFMAFRGSEAEDIRRFFCAPENPAVISVTSSGSLAKGSEPLEEANDDEVPF